ncbi:hypothetical protein [Streptomyces sp. NBC_00564]|uniref:hypothetical protein n=1 Tax=unclassified Streptomyces TaxID=2593676 RepID=UPI002FCDB92A|nr:hypothetical protein OG256_44555 [Streptomyces sp. NBC_00564]WUC47077.1 hypothetical protein OG266_00910 [Streptomyces sp. NBC_00554]
MTSILITGGHSGIGLAAVRKLNRAAHRPRPRYDEPRAAQLWDDSKRLVHLTDEEEPTQLR